MLMNLSETAAEMSSTMKSRANVTLNAPFNPDIGLPAGVTRIASISNGFEFAGVPLRRDTQGGFGVYYDGRAFSEPTLPNAIVVDSWLLTDSGTLDCPRPGLYELDGACGHVSTFEQNNGGGRWTIKWTLEVFAMDLDAAQTLFDGIRSGTIKPSRPYRSGTLTARLRQWWGLRQRRTLSPSTAKQ